MINRMSTDASNCCKQALLTGTVLYMPRISSNAMKAMIGMLRVRGHTMKQVFGIDKHVWRRAFSRWEYQLNLWQPASNMHLLETGKL